MKKIIIYFSLISLIPLIIFAFLFFFKTDSLKIQYFKFINQSLETLPILKSKTSLQSDIAVKQQRKHEGLIHYMLDQYTDYSLEIYKLPFDNYFNSQDKPAGYLEQTNSEVIIASGSGNFIYFDKSEIDKENIVFKPIKSNIKSVVRDSLFHTVGSRSIKDLKMIDSYLYLTYTKRVKQNCYNISVLRAVFNFEKLNFEEAFSPDECLDDGYKKQSGGRIFPYKDNKILLSVGVFNHNKKAQKLDNIFGKIVSFKPMNNNYEIISLGHRNPQGLYYDNDDDVILNTEHQALGGDEVNVNHGKDLKNYGWPISSYGSHYGRRVIKDEPLHNSHSKYGFEEPLIYFTPAIGISQITKAPKSFSKGSSKDFLVSSMGDGINEGGDMSLHHLRMDENFKNIEYHNLIPIGERIRDIEVLNDRSDIILILESVPAIAILSQKNYSCNKKLPPCNINKFYTKTSSGMRESYKKLLP